jgi:ATP-binding cassette subfamily C (CFTR/MRP) protein 1
MLNMSSAPQSYFSETDVGTTLNRFSQDMGLIDHNLPLAGATTVIRKYASNLQQYFNIDCIRNIHSN